MIYRKNSRFAKPKTSYFQRVQKKFEGVFSVSNMDILEEWPLVDEYGQRYRTVGEHCREYMPRQIVHIKPAPDEPPRERRRDCPFLRGSDPECNEKCTFFFEGGCNRSTATAGKRCPVSGFACGDECMMFNNGRCGLFWKE